MATLVAFARDLFSDKARSDSTISDRLNHQYTTTMLVIFAFVVSTKQYVGEPIRCWSPAHFTENHDEYTNNFCWVRNTYFLPYDDEIPKEDQDWKRHFIVYYQWMPMILLFLSAGFYLPSVLWQTLADRSGLDVETTAQTAKDIASFQMKDDIRDRLYQKMVTQIHRYLSNCKKDNDVDDDDGMKVSCTLSLKHVFSKTVCRPCGRQKGNYLTSLYLCVKSLYLVNVFFQFLLLNAFLDADFYLFGIRAIQSLTRGEEMVATRLFPRVTMCDFKVRRLGSIHRYTVQCVLSVNLFNEKICLFLWFWFLIVAVVTFTSLLKWSLRAVVKIDRRRYVLRHLRLAGVLGWKDSDEKMEKEQKLSSALQEFVDAYLKQDGVFILHMINQSTNTLVAFDLTTSLCLNYLRKKGLINLLPQKKSAETEEDNKSESYNY